MSTHDLGFNSLHASPALVRRLTSASTSRTRSTLVGPSPPLWLGGATNPPSVDGRLYEEECEYFLRDSYRTHDGHWTMPPSANANPAAGERTGSKHPEQAKGRLHQVPVVRLAQAWRLTQHQRYLEGVRNHLRTWLYAPRELQIPRGTTGMTAALRLISWAIAWQLLDSGKALANLDSTLQRAWMGAIINDAHWLRLHRSRYGHANHRVICEAVTLQVVGGHVAAMVRPG